jgi:CDGSH iron-sulfur domain-containing protein 3
MRHLPGASKPDSECENAGSRLSPVPVGNGVSTMSDEAVVAQTGPYQVELTEGQEYWYCRCGRSKAQPFCDGSHEGTSFEPMKFIPDRTGTFNICGCKATDDEPYCDGTHNVL